jgi:hypothetical protein
MAMVTLMVGFVVPLVAVTVMLVEDKTELGVPEI